MNNFIYYLFTIIEDEKEIIDKFIKLDNLIQGESISYDDFINFLKENLYNNNFYNKFFTNKIIITDGDFKTTIKVLSNLYAFNTLVTSNCNVAINKWIVSKYYDYVSSYKINSDLDFIYSDNFNFDNRDVVLIGDSNLIDYYKSVIDSKNIIEIFE